MRRQILIRGGWSAAIVIVLSVLGARQTLAISFAYSGTIDTVVDDNGVLDGSVTNGTAFNGVIRFDSSTSDVNNSAIVGQYPQPLPPNRHDVNLGSYSITDHPTGYLITIVDGPAFDQWQFNTSPFPFPGISGVTLRSYGPNLLDSSSTAFGDDSLPAAPPDLAAFNARSFFVTGCLDSELMSGACPQPLTLQITGTIDTITELPEPGTALLLVTGLLALALRQRSA